jgi:hypothetical protein
MSVFILCSADLDGTAVTTLSGSSWNAGMQRAMVGAAGNYKPEFVALMSQMSRGQFSTRKIDACPAIVMGGGGLFFRAVEEGGVGNSTYVSLIGTASKTLIVPNQLTWGADKPAELSVDIYFLSSDGIAAPLTVGATAGSLTPEDSVWVGNGDGVNQITLKFGFKLKFPRDGRLYQVHSFVESQEPELSIVTTERGSLLTTANLNPGSVGTLTATFDKLTDGGVRSATQKSYAVAGHYHVENVQGAKPGTVQLFCAGKSLTIT